MRIGLVVLGGFHPSGRFEVVPLWLSLASRLARQHDVHAFVLHHLDRPQTYTLQGVHVHDLGSPARAAAVSRWAQWRALDAAVRSHAPFDVLHGIWADPAGMMAAGVARGLRLPSVVTFDSGELVGIDDIGYGLQRTWQGRMAVRTAARWATRLHVCTEYMERLARGHGLDVVRMPIGVDPVLVPQHTAPGEGPPWRLLQVASLNPVKDQRMLLDAVVRAARVVDVHLDLVGADTLDGAIARYADSLGIGARVTFHGFLPYDLLPALRARAHLYVQTSRHEAAGAAVLEAAAAGLPIVGTRVGYLADWSPTAATAVDPGDAAGLADAIVRLLGDPERRGAQARVARELALAHDAEWSTTAIVRLYEESMRSLPGR